MKNTITFEGERTSVSSSGNTEWYDFVITSQRSLSRNVLREIGNVHGMGGQSFSFEEKNENGLNIYTCKATCHCD